MHTMHLSLIVQKSGESRVKALAGLVSSKHLLPNSQTVRLSSYLSSASRSEWLPSQASFFRDTHLIHE